MELTARLQALADQVPQGTVFADIGTDHAYLPVWLILNGRIKSAIAADLREGPLSRAQNTAMTYGVSEQISFRLCDGLTGVRPEEADTIAIAGMGGETIATILEAAPWTRENGTLLLLQPMTSFPDLRKWLFENGYCIECENISKEGQRYYTCLTVRGGEMFPMTPAELWVGRQSSDPLRKAYLKYMRRKIERALSGKRSAAEPDAAAIEELRQVLSGICEMEGAYSNDQRT